MPFTIIRDDLANVRADAVILPANEMLAITGGAGASVAERAGLALVQNACEQLGGCETGHAVATPAFDFPARHLVHAVGPQWQGGGANEARLLRQTYDSALALAHSLGSSSIALPLLSTGSFGYPTRAAFEIALEAIRAFLEKAEAHVTLVVFDRKAVAEGIRLFGAIEHYIDDTAAAHRALCEDTMIAGSMRAEDAVAESRPNRITPPALPREAAPCAAAPRESAPRPQRKAKAPWKLPTRRKLSLDEGVGPDEIADAAGFDHLAAPFVEPATATAPSSGTASVSTTPVATQGAVRLEDILNRLDEPFSATLLRIIDERGLTDAQVYKRANMSRQLFSKIRSSADYRPTKRTVLALALALELSLDETQDLLARAGLALSHANKADVIVEFFIIRGIYDIFAVNEALYAFDQPLL